MVCVVPGARSAGELASGVVEAAGDGAVDDVVADLDADAADDVGVDDDVEVHRAAVLRGRARSASRCCSLVVERRGPPGRWRPAARGARPRPAGSSSSATRRRCGARRLTACSTSRTRGRGGLALEQAARAARACRRRRGPGRTSASRSSGFAGDEPLEARTARPRARSASPVGSATATTATTPRCSSASARSRVAAQRRPTAVGDQVERRPRRACRRRCRAARPALASAVDRRVGGDPAQAGLARAARRRPRTGRRRPRRRPRRPRAPRRARSVSACERLGGGAAASARSVPVRRPSRGSCVSRSARKRSTTRLWRASSSRRLADDAAGEVGGQRPTSARSEVTACWRSASIWVCAVLDDARGLGLGLLAHLGDDRAPCSRASSRMRAASCRASASCFSSSASLASASACLVSAACRPPSMAAVRSAKVFSKLGTTNFLTSEEQQAEDDQRRG